MKKSFAKKSLSILLSLLMLLSVFGVAASAYDAPEGYVQIAVAEDYIAPDGLTDGDLWLNADVYKTIDAETEEYVYPTAYYNETTQTLIIVDANDAAMTYESGSEAFAYLHRVGELAADDYAAEGFILLGVGYENAVDEYYLRYDYLSGNGAIYYNPTTGTVKIAYSDFYAVDYTQEDESYAAYANLIGHGDPSVAPQIDLTGYIAIPYTAAEALAAGEEGLYLYFDVLKLEGIDLQAMTIEEKRALLVEGLASQSLDYDAIEAQAEETVAAMSVEELTEAYQALVGDAYTGEETVETMQIDVTRAYVEAAQEAAEAAAMEEVAPQVAAMSDEEVLATFDQMAADASEQMKDYFGDIYFNPAAPSIILIRDGYSVTLVPAEGEPDWSQGVVYEEVYAAFNTAVPVFAPVVAGGEDETDVLDPATIVVYAKGDVNLLGATMTVTANAEITPEEIAKAESLPEMAGLAISKLTSFDITFSKGDSTNLQPSAGADVTIRMPVPEGYDEEKIAVFHIDGEGVVQKVASTISNGFILAKAAFGFSPYFIAEVEEATTEEPTTDEAVEAAIAAIAAIGEVAYTDASKALIDAADAAYAALTDAQKANVTNAAVLAAAKTAYAELKAAAEATEPSTEEPTTEPENKDDGKTEDNTKGFMRYVKALISFLKDLFDIFTKILKK